MSEEKVFTSLCGFPFDPSKSSDCWQECQADNPEAFQACLSHFNDKPAKTKKSTKARSTSGGSGRGKNRWGHLIGSQAELIDRALINADGPVTLNEIAKAANARPPRTRHHILHLINDLDVLIKQNAEGIFLQEKFPETKGKEYK